MLCRRGVYPCRRGCCATLLLSLLYVREGSAIIDGSSTLNQIGPGKFRLEGKFKGARKGCECNDSRGIGIHIPWNEKRCHGVIVNTIHRVNTIQNARSLPR